MSFLLIKFVVSIKVNLFNNKNKYFYFEIDFVNDELFS
jgi:hypothetical protein